MTPMKLTKSPATADGTLGSSAVPQPDRQLVLLLVHLQNDFSPGGPWLRLITSFQLSMPVFASLPVKGCRLLPHAIGTLRTIVLFKHTAGHGLPIIAYKSHEGSQFHPDLMPTRHVDCLRATDSRQKVCSGFDGTSLEDRLEELAVQTIFVVGLATDACVKQTVLDACRLGFRVVVLENGIRGMNAQPEDSQKAIQERQEPSWQRQPIWDFRCNRPLAHFL